MKTFRLNSMHRCIQDPVKYLTVTVNIALLENRLHFLKNQGNVLHKALLHFPSYHKNYSLFQ